jgi:hypothetical protein
VIYALGYIDLAVDGPTGPELPDGAPATNCLRTEPGKEWFTLFRSYSPTQEFFDRSWKPNDFEKLGQRTLI